MARAPRGTSKDRARAIADRYFDIEDGAEKGAGTFDPVFGYPTDPPERGPRLGKASPPPPQPRELTAKERRFVAEYLVDTNATQAAIRAGYSASTARAIGHELLTKPHIRKLIDAALAEGLKRIGWDKDRLLERLGNEVVADLGDLFHEDGTMRPISDWPLIWRQGLVAGIETEERVELDGSALAAEGEMRGARVVIRKIKLSDRLRRLELIGKHVGVQAFKEKVEHDVPPDSPLAVLARQLENTALRPRQTETAPTEPADGGR